MKKLINEPADVISEALRGMAIAHPNYESTRPTGSSTAATRRYPGRWG